MGGLLGLSTPLRILFLGVTSHINKWAPLPLLGFQPNFWEELLVGKLSLGKSPLGKYLPPIKMFREVSNQRIMKNQTSFSAQEFPGGRGADFFLWGGAHGSHWHIYNFYSLQKGIIHLVYSAYSRPQFGLQSSCIIVLYSLT